MNGTDLPAPLIPTDVDLRDFAFTPMFRGRLFGSEFHANVSDAGWRAGVTLWLKSWDQVPAGTLPTDEVSLCRLAELGRDIKTWKKIAKEALWGWFKCSDGRLHHKVVAEGVMEAWERKVAQRDRTAKARATALSKRQSQNPENTTTDRVTAPPTRSVTDSVTGSKGQREGQGQRDLAAAQQPRGVEAETPERPSARLDRVLAACSEALGDQAPPDPVIGPIVLLLDRGARLDEVLTVLRSEAQRPRRQPVRTWKLWAEKIAEALGDAPAIPTKAAPVEDPNDPLVKLAEGVAWPESLVRKVTDRFDLYPDSWPDGIGPAPGRPGCRVPQHLLPERLRQPEEVRH